MYCTFTLLLTFHYVNYSACMYSIAYSSFANKMVTLQSHCSKSRRFSGDQHVTMHSGRPEFDVRGFLGGLHFRGVVIRLLATQPSYTMTKIHAVTSNSQREIESLGRTSSFRTALDGASLSPVAYLPRRLDGDHATSTACEDDPSHVHDG